MRQSEVQIIFDAKERMPFSPLNLDFSHCSQLSGARCGWMVRFAAPVAFPYTVAGSCKAAIMGM
jgi:hypothetical protein